MKKVLYIGTTNIYGGVGHIMFQLCNNMNRDNISFDFLYYQDATPEEKEMIHALGGEFYQVPRYSKNSIAFYKTIKTFYKEHHYDIIHIHASSAMLMMYAFPVWKNKESHIVYQSHSDKIDGKGNQILHKFFQKYVNRYAEYKLAVSNIAAEYMYGKDNVQNTIILKNGIDIKSFMFQETIRDKIRKELKIESSYVIGHVGRFSLSKNHPFIIDLFANVHKKCPDSVLLLVGNGENEEMIHERVEEYGLTDSVIFHGTSDSVNELLCAMDCFIFPSLWEGLGIVAIEAQASGLPVIASDKVPLEAKVSDLLIYKNLEDGIEEWSNIVLKVEAQAYDRKKYNAIVAESGYSIDKVAIQLENIYLDT